MECHMFYSLFRFDCKHFDLPQPDMAIAEELKADLTQHESMWTLYDEFTSGMSNLEKEEWILFR